MAGGGPGNPGSQSGFNARLATGGGVSNTLTLLPYAGNKILIGSFVITVPALGLTTLVSDHLITAAGADFGIGGNAQTLYYVYVSNPAATFAPSSIRLSATPPILLNGVKYLGAAGNALNWRFVGYVYLNGTPQFESDSLNQLIVNYYNRLALNLFTCPAYVDANAQVSYAISNADWSALNGGVGSRVTYIANGEDEESFHCHFNFNPNNNQCAGGLGIDGPSTSKFSDFTPSTPIADNTTVSGSYSEIGTVGFHTADILGIIATGAGTVNANDEFRGGTHAPYTTYLTGTIYG